MNREMLIKNDDLTLFTGFLHAYLCDKTHYLSFTIFVLFFLDIKICSTLDETIVLIMSHIDR